MFSGVRKRAGKSENIVKLAEPMSHAHPRSKRAIQRKRFKDVSHIIEYVLFKLKKESEPQTENYIVSYLYESWVVVPWNSGDF
jgi:hypothetical protein